MTILLYRAYGVVVGDIDVIRRIAADRHSTDTAVGLVFAAVLLGTMRYGTDSPIQWFATSALMSTVGLALYASVAWLIGMGLQGIGRFSGFVRTGGYVIAPVALGGVSTTGLAVGFGIAFLVAVGVIRAVHELSWSLSALSAILPVVVSGLVGLIVPHSPTYLSMVQP